MKNTTEKLLEIHHKNIADLKVSLKDLQQKTNSDKIHKMRIAVKELRSLMHFLDYATQKKSLKELPGQLKNLFSASGKCRDMRNTLNSAPEEIPFKKALEKQLMKRQIYYQKKLDKMMKKSFKGSIRTINKKIDNTIRKFSAKDLQKELFAYLNFMEKKVTLYSNISNIDSRELHYLRKILKRMVYQHAFIDKIFPKQKNPMVVTQLESAAQLIGSWHDAKTAFNQIIKITWKENQENQEILSVLKKKEKHLYTEVEHALKETYALLKNEIELTLV